MNKYGLSFNDTYFSIFEVELYIFCVFLNEYSQGPGHDARIVYIDGAFDLFHAGHVEVNTTL